MFAIRRHGQHVRRAPTRHGAFALLLLLAVVFAPIARAVCSIEHGAPPAVGSIVDVSTAAGTLSDGHFPGHDGCCMDAAQALAAADQPLALLAGSKLLSPGVDLLPLLHSELAPPSRSPVLSSRRRVLPPYEPVNRRVRRLLI